MVTKTSTFLEYMKIHLISLNQDLEDARNNVALNEDEYHGGGSESHRVGYTRR